MTLLMATSIMRGSPKMTRVVHVQRFQIDILLNALVSSGKSQSCLWCMTAQRPPGMFGSPLKCLLVLLQRLPS